MAKGLPDPWWPQGSPRGSFSTFKGILPAALLPRERCASPLGGQAEGWDREGLGRASPLSPREPGRAAVLSVHQRKPRPLRSPRPRWLWDTFQTLRRRVRLRLPAARTHRPPAATQVRGNRPDVRSAGGALPGRTATGGRPPSTYVSRRPTPEAEAAGARLGSERRCGLPVVAAARCRLRDGGRGASPAAAAVQEHPAPSANRAGAGQARAGGGVLL